MKTDINITNKKAGYEYEFIDKFTAGIQLLGSEIKSIRAGKASIKESYCLFIKDELWIRNMDISEYAQASTNNHKPKRDRKLLLNKLELRKLRKKIDQKGLSIVATRLYISQRGFAKLNIALAKGKKIYDKRESLKNKDSKREMDRLLKDR
ncbi:MAG TPA: SsrA-binding protein SmpB [Flavobacteriales bacterium]|nr:SsrA-binding protein SmpB [Flavobacteriales bacterium]HIO68848.1 SsrA-binding protein SmpB [Flavobacteriales bacterium]